MKKIRNNPIFPTGSLGELSRELGVLWRELADNVISAWKLPVYTMDTLPTDQQVGDIAYATDGWNHGEQGYNENGAFVVSDGTNWKTPYHRHYVTFGISLNPPSMSNNEIWEYSFATDAVITPGYGWVSEGNMVTVGAPPNVETGFLWNAYVSAEDEITFRLYNRSGGTVDPATASWNFAIFPQT